MPKPQMISGSITSTIHAPSTNLLTATIISVIDVAAAPSPLIRAFAPQRGPRVCTQWTTIPAWDSVNARKTPTANSGISAWVSPPNTMISRALKPASTSIPLEKTRRSPSRASWRGR